GTPLDGLRRDLETQLAKLPTVRGASSSYASQRLNSVFDRAQTQADGFKDEYVSTEHLLLAITQDTASAAGQILRRHGVTQEGLLAALREVRGNQKVTDENPEDKYQALQRYARDLTDAARKGKLDRKST